MDKQTFFNNRYVRMTILTVLGAVLIYLLLRMAFFALDFDQSQFPDELMIPVSLLASGYVVYRYLSRGF